MVPEDFRGPVNFAVVPIYVPIMMQREAMPGRDLIESRGNNMMTMVARLRDGATVERAAQVLDAVLLQLKVTRASWARRSCRRWRPGSTPASRARSWA